MVCISASSTTRGIPTVSGQVVEHFTFAVPLRCVVRSLDLDHACVVLFAADPEWYPFIEADTATAFPGGEGDENSRFRFLISITG